ncbi:MAG: A24 family peptidase [Phycisphaeraceae bacterium]|nr:A24 family peptidase [Phycisphaeraceae bacterium]
MTLGLLSYQWLQLGAELFKLAFVFWLGACVGSLTNVLVYRLPRGLNVVLPSSRCPKCGTRLAWRDNIPILGWIALRGRCRYCKLRISPEYPIVELIVALLFAGVFFLFYTLDGLQNIGLSTTFLGVDWLSVRPEWAGVGRGLEHSWPMLVVLLCLLGALVAITLIDAKTFTIPLVLTWVPAAVAVVGIPLWAWWIQRLLAAHPNWTAFRWADGWSFAIASPGPTGWRTVGASIGAVVGLGVGLVLLRLGLIGRSFADYEQWEAEAIKADSEEASQGASPEPGESDPPGAPQDDENGRKLTATGTERPAGSESDSRLGSGGFWRAGLHVTALTLLCGLVGAGIGALTGRGLPGVLIGLLAGPIVAGLALPSVRSARAAKRATAEAGGESSDAATMWIQYPHARREMVRELAFLAPCAVLGWIGAWLAYRLAGPWTPADPFTGDSIPAAFVPLWLDALSGVLLGYLVGGGVVWAVRILGSVAFGKEAMGLGDVHLMAAVGACLGWIDPFLAFFLAAFVALYLELVGRSLLGGFRRAMPFGPSLAIATLLVVLCKPGIESALTAWLHRPMDLP